MRDIPADVAAIAKIASLGKELTEAQLQAVAAAALRLLEGLLIDIHTIAEAQAVQAQNVDLD